MLERIDQTIAGRRQRWSLVVSDQMLTTVLRRCKRVEEKALKKKLLEVRVTMLCEQCSTDVLGSCVLWLYTVAWVKYLL